MKRATLLCVVLAATAAHADEVFLRGGGKVTGTIMERTATGVVLEVGPGWVTVPLARVERIQEGPSALSDYRERARRLASDDVRGWLELAQWAQDRELPTQAREALEKVLSLDPDNATANQALGRVLLDDRWVRAEDAFRARGLVPFEGSWVTPSERGALLRERADAVAVERLRLEAEARVREAEARAREAEARAQVAEAEAHQAAASLEASETASSGIPFFPFVYPGVSPVVVAPGFGPGSCRTTTRPRPRPFGPGDGWAHMFTGPTSYRPVTRPVGAAAPPRPPSAVQPPAGRTVRANQQN